jgi:glycosyltransferase involved in cell wall biosynthesis
VRAGLISRVRVSPLRLASTPTGPANGSIGPNRVEDLAKKIPGGVYQLPIWNLRPELSAGALEGLLRRVAPGATIVLHTRQLVMATLGLELKRRWPELRIIAEIEGDDFAELDYRQALEPRAGLAKRLRWALERRHFDREDRRILLASDAVLCVSQVLKQVLLQRYALSGERASRVHVMPTFASRESFRFSPERRARTRAEGEWDDRFLVIYSGNLRGPWQVPHQLVEAFRFVREQRPNAFFLVLTPDSSDRRYIEPHLERAGIPATDWSLRSAPHERIVDHLCAADVGLLLRDRHPMNEAASPGKFGEYTLSGLPIVMTEGIGDFSALARDHEMACVLPGLDDPAVMRQRIRDFSARDFSLEQRAAFSRWAGERFAIETVIPRLAELYRTV